MPYTVVYSICNVLYTTHYALWTMLCTFCTTHYICKGMHPRRHSLVMKRARSSVGLPLRPLLRAQGAGDRIDASAQRVGREDEAFLEQPTPYGPLKKNLQLPAADGGTVSVPYCCPFALLFLAAQQCSGLVNFVLTCLQGQAGRLALYVDEVRSGNALRPDKGRAYHVLYWSCMEFPSWFLSSAAGWFTLLFITSRALDRVKGGMASLMQAVLLALWHPEEWNFHRLGVRLPRLPESEAGPAPPAASEAGPAPPGVIVKFRFGCFLSDEKALKEITQAKGASGCKPCVSCANIVGRVDARQVPQGYLLHYSSAEWNRFDLWTHERFSSMQALVKETWETKPRAAAVEMERHCGVSFESGIGLVWGPARSIARVPECLYWDAMHCIWASGGIAQYEANQFLLCTSEAGIPLRMVNEFKNRFVLPIGSKTLHAFDLEERVVPGIDKHIRGFAQEIMSLLVVLFTFGDLVLRPRGLLLRHVRCMELLYEITELLTKPQGRCDVPHLRVLNSEHHALFTSLYPACVKPKLHYVWHVLDCRERFGMLMMCFAPERKHRESKQLGSFCFRNMTKTLLCRCTAKSLLALAGAGVFEPMRFMGRIAEASLSHLATAPHLLPGLTKAKKGSQLRTPTATIQAKQFIFWSEAGPTRRLRGGVVRLCLELHYDSVARFVLLVQPYLHMEGSRFRCSEGVVLVPAPDILGPVAYLLDGQDVLVIHSPAMPVEL